MHHIVLSSRLSSSLQYSPWTVLHDHPSHASLQRHIHRQRLHSLPFNSRTMAPLTSPSDIFRRALSDTADIECPRPLPNEHGDPLFGPGSINLRQLMIYVSAPCLFLTVVSCWFLCWRHLHRYTSPQEQRQILRIVNLPIAYSLFNFLAITFVKDYMYIEPLAAIYEAFTVAALFYLVLEWVVPDGK